MELIGLFTRGLYFPYMICRHTNSNCVDVFVVFVVYLFPFAIIVGIVDFSLQISDSTTVGTQEMRPLRSGEDDADALVMPCMRTRGNEERLAWLIESAGLFLAIVLFTYSNST